MFCCSSPRSICIAALFALLLSSALWGARDSSGVIGMVLAQKEGSYLVHPSGKREVLVLSMPLYQGDRVETGEKSYAQLGFLDGTLIALAPNSDVEIHDFSFDEKKQQGNALFEFENGTVRFSAGEIAKGSPDYFALRTATALITVKGSAGAFITSDGTRGTAPGLRVQVQEGHILEITSLSGSSLQDSLLLSDPKEQVNVYSTGLLEKIERGFTIDEHITVASEGARQALATNPEQERIFGVQMVKEKIRKLKKKIKRDLIALGLERPSREEGELAAEKPEEVLEEDMDVALPEEEGGDVGDIIGEEEIDVETPEEEIDVETPEEGGDLGNVTEEEIDIDDLEDALEEILEDLEDLDEELEEITESIDDLEEFVDDVVEEHIEENREEELVDGLDNKGFFLGKVAGDIALFDVRGGTTNQQALLGGNPALSDELESFALTKELLVEGESYEGFTVAQSADENLSAGELTSALAMDNLGEFFIVNRVEEDTAGVGFLSDKEANPRPEGNATRYFDSSDASLSSHENLSGALLTLDGEIEERKLRNTALLSDDEGILFGRIYDEETGVLKATYITLDTIDYYFGSSKTTAYVNPSFDLDVDSLVARSWSVDRDVSGYFGSEQQGMGLVASLTEGGRDYSLLAAGFESAAPEVDLTLGGSNLYGSYSGLFRGVAAVIQGGNTTLTANDLNEGGISLQIGKPNKVSSVTLRNFYLNGSLSVENNGSNASYNLGWFANFSTVSLKPNAFFLNTDHLHTQLTRGGDIGVNRGFMTSHPLPRIDGKAPSEVMWGSLQVIDDLTTAGTYYLNPGQHSFWILTKNQSGGYAPDIHEGTNNAVTFYEGGLMGTVALGQTAADLHSYGKGSAFFRVEDQGATDEATFLGYLGRDYVLLSRGIIRDSVGDPDTFGIDGSTETQIFSLEPFQMLRTTNSLLSPSVTVGDNANRFLEGTVVGGSTGDTLALNYQWQTAGNLPLTAGVGVLGKKTTLDSTTITEGPFALPTLAFHTVGVSEGGPNFSARDRVYVSSIQKYDLSSAGDISFVSKDSFVIPDINTKTKNILVNAGSIGASVLVALPGLEEFDGVSWGVWDAQNAYNQHYMTGYFAAGSEPLISLQRDFNELKASLAGGNSILNYTGKAIGSVFVNRQFDSSVEGVVSLKLNTSNFKLSGSIELPQDTININSGFSIDKDYNYTGGLDSGKGRYTGIFFNGSDGTKLKTIVGTFAKGDSKRLVQGSYAAQRD